MARTIDYYFAVSEYLKEIKSPYQAIIAYSGKHEVNGKDCTEADLNNFPSTSNSEKLVLR